MVEPILACNYLYHYYQQLYRIGVTFAREREREREREKERERERERERAELGRLRVHKVPTSFVSNIGTNIVKA